VKNGRGGLKPKEAGKAVSKLNLKRLNSGHLGRNRASEFLRKYYKGEVGEGGHNEDKPRKNARPNPLKSASDRDREDA